MVYSPKTWTNELGDHLPSALFLVVDERVMGIATVAGFNELIRRAAVHLGSAAERLRVAKAYMCASWADECLHGPILPDWGVPKWVWLSQAEFVYVEEPVAEGIRQSCGWMPATAELLAELRRPVVQSDAHLTVVELYMYEVDGVVRHEVVVGEQGVERHCRQTMVEWFHCPQESDRLRDYQSRRGLEKVCEVWE